MALVVGDYATLRDDFNRADANPLDGSWTNKVVSTHSDMKVVSNQLAASAAATCSAYFTGATPGANFEACVTIATLPATGGKVLLYGRLINEGGATPSGYLVEVTINAGTDETRIYADNMAAPTSLDGGLNQSDWQAGDKLWVEMVTYGIVVYRERAGAVAFLCSSWNSNYTADNEIGLGLTDTTARLDDFQFGQYGAMFPNSASLVDDFNRANETPLASPWAEAAGGTQQWNLASNAISTYAANADAYITSVTHEHVEVYATISTKPANNSEAGVMGRVTDAGTSTWDAYHVSLDASGAGPDIIQIGKTANGVSSALIASDAYEFATGDKMGLRVRNDVVEMWLYAPAGTGGVAWSKLGGLQDGDVSGSGYVGVRCQLASGTVGLDDVYAGPALAIDELPQIIRHVVRYGIS